MKQNRRTTSQTKAEQVYTVLLHTYPRAHRQEYGPVMLQAFKDHYHDTRAIQGRIGIGFWLEVLADVTTSSLSEQWAAFQGGLPMQRIWNHLGVSAGLLLGGLAIVGIVLSNVVFPSTESDSEYTSVYLLGYVSIFLVFVVIGLLASRHTNRILSGTWAGAIAALLGGGIALGTFFVVDNLFLSIVSQQVDKLHGFHQSTFPTMRAYVNAGLLAAVLIGLPFLGGAGAAGGTLGAMVQKRIWRVSPAR
jgi:hypothetical protein